MKSFISLILINFGSLGPPYAVRSLQCELYKAACVCVCGVTCRTPEGGAAARSNQIRLEGFILHSLFFSALFASPSAESK